MASQVFKIIRAPEAPPITASALRSMLYDLRKDTEFEVVELPLSAQEQPAASDGGSVADCPLCASGQMHLNCEVDNS